ncbi:hypothetical protein HanLR1_Chr04g0153421 [Helianthus annuus]|nr:hypothetical protein HanLR1_Chr04g0153421 [Helianthus annuus]
MSKTLKTKQAKVESLKSEKNNNDLSSQKSEHRNLETEIGRLKELYENERKVAYCEAKKAETEKRNTHKVKEMLKAQQWGGSFNQNASREEFPVQRAVRETTSLEVRT